MKGQIHGFHMRNRRLISIHRLHRKINFGPLPFFPLVDVQSSVSHLCGTPALNADGMSVAATKGQRSRARHPRREGGRDRGEEVAREIDPAKSFRQLPPDSHESSVETAGDPPAALPEIDCSLCSSYAPTIIHRVQPYFMQCNARLYNMRLNRRCGCLIVQVHCLSSVWR